MKETFRAGVTGLIACASLVLAVSCNIKDDNIEPSPVSYVSLYNASPDAPDLDIVVDDEQINAYPFEYSDNTGYLSFYSGNRNLKFRPSGASNIAVDTTVTLETEKAYSIFVVDEFEKAGVLVLNDNSEVPAPGKAKVRFVNLSPDGESVQLKVKEEATPLTEGRSFKEASNFILVDAKTYNFEVTPEGNSTPILQLPDTHIQEERFYTILVRGYTSPPTGNTNILSAEVIVN